MSLVSTLVTSRAHQSHPYMVHGTGRSQPPPSTVQHAMLSTMRQVVGELGFEQSTPTKLYTGNEPLISTTASDRGPSEKSKHILLRFQVLKEQYQCGTTSLLHLATRIVVVDTLTKALSSPEWLRLRLALLGQSPVIFNPVQSPTPLAD